MLNRVNIAHPQEKWHISTKVNFTGEKKKGGIKNVHKRLKLLRIKIFDGKYI